MNIIIEKIIQILLLSTATLYALFALYLPLQFAFGPSMTIQDYLLVFVEMIGVALFIALGFASVYNKLKIPLFFRVVIFLLFITPLILYIFLEL